jgi:hypothetical protein
MLRVSSARARLNRPIASSKFSRERVGNSARPLR